MSSIVMGKVNLLIMQLKKSVKKILSRKKGFLIGTSIAVQHLNPACRAARKVPKLSLARLLISLSDYDVPKVKPKRSNFLGYIYGTLFWVLVSFILFLSLLPEVIQDVTIEATVTVSVNMVYFTIFAGADDIFMSFLVGTGLIFGTFILAEIVARQTRPRESYGIK